LYSSVG